MIVECELCRQRETDEREDIREKYYTLCPKIRMNVVCVIVESK